MTPTAARPTPRTDSHWYFTDGKPCYEIEKKDGSGMRNTTLADARKLNLLPSVTTILKILHKEGLVNWMIEQAALAVLTAPRKEGEGLDAFVLRVLHTEEQQHGERDIARDRGIAIHDAIEALMRGEQANDEILPWVKPAFDALIAYGKPVATERILVGNGFAGKTDLVMDSTDHWRLWDFKGTGRLPDPARGAWPEHRLQLAAYARAYQQLLDTGGPEAGADRPIVVGNVYISTAKQGEFVIIEHEDWEVTFDLGFAPLIQHWQWANNYFPSKPEAPKPARQAQAAQSAQEPTPQTVKVNLPIVDIRGRKAVVTTSQAQQPPTL